MQLQVINNQNCKIMHFRHISAKIQPKKYQACLLFYLIAVRGNIRLMELGSPPGYTLDIELYNK